MTDLEPHYFQPGELLQDVQPGDYLPTKAPTLWARVTRVLSDPDTGEQHVNFETTPVEGPRRGPLSSELPPVDPLET